MDQRIKAIVKANIGANLYNALEALRVINLFLKSLIASAPGCSSPDKPGLLGPNRSCVNLRILRSSKVIKATLIKTIKVSKAEST